MAGDSFGIDQPLQPVCSAAVQRDRSAEGGLVPMYGPFGKPNSRRKNPTFRQKKHREI